MDKSDFAKVSCDRLERLVEHGAVGIKFWKDLGLSVRDGSGELLRIDDDRLAPIFDKAAELGIPVMFPTQQPIPTHFFYRLTRITNATKN